ncbi:MAG: DUF6295 family protein [Ferrimicrobium sp.]
MCTYMTASVAIRGNAKAAQEWSPVRSASVYLDHPVAFASTHALNVDIFAEENGRPVRRVALELDPKSARAMAEAIMRMLDEAPPGLLQEFDS